jgi:hypothetical protein
MEHPQPYSDTDPRAMKVWLNLQRKMPAGDKLAAVLAASHLVMRIAEAGVRLQYPHANEHEVFLHAAARHLGRDLMARVYGGDHPRGGTPADGCRRLIETLDRCKIPYMVGGSAASSLHSMYIYLVVNLRTDEVDDFLAKLKADFYADPEMMRDALARGRFFNLIHYASSFKFDIFPLQSDDYSQTQFGRRRFVETRLLADEPIECVFATAEDTILTKLRWYRAGGETSERQWNDLRGILQVSGAGLDLDYLNIWAPRLGVADLLAHLLAELRS